MIDSQLKRSLCEMQGKLFELSGTNGYDSCKFIKTFMNSKIARGLDADFDFMQWAGKEYILEVMVEEYPEACEKGVVYPNEALYWMGYLYRYWHFYTGESSKVIYRIANAKRMNEVYFGLHTMDVESAIDRLKQM